MSVDTVYEVVFTEENDEVVCSVLASIGESIPKYIIEGKGTTMEEAYEAVLARAPWLDI